MSDVAEEIIAMEKAALSRWGKGDPDGFLEICAPDVVYFDPCMEMRLDGLPALIALYETIRGQVRYDRFELLNPHVQASADLAVLTFNYVSYTGDQTSRWNCTEAYRLESDGRWRIVQTHWSYTNMFKYRKG
ncbi:MAG: nuclear transport factor 2 family protein [Chloroflexi bacterium]|nr:nuclear transport factor 2 family protein [Chloroflexota bacterium]